MYRKLLGLLALLLAAPAFAQFSPNTILTAAALNAALAAPTITGGTINGAPIGQAVPAPISGTTVTSAGLAAFGGGVNPSDSVLATGTYTSGATQRAFSTFGWTASPTATSITGFHVILATAANSSTVTSLYDFFASDVSKGASSTVTNQYGFYIADLTQAVNNYGFYSGVSSGTNKFNLYLPGTAFNYIQGPVEFGGMALTVPQGGIGMATITADGLAPGASGGKIQLVCGTGSHTAKLVISAGTSSAITTIIDNVGTGVTGC